MAKRKNPLIEQEKRKQQQEDLVRKAQGIDKIKKKKLTLLLPEDDISTVKKMAIDQQTSVSAMMHAWIKANTDN